MTGSRFSDAPAFSAEFYATLPTKHVAAACLFTDEAGQVLLLKPTYKDPWELPGGAVEAGESPFDACRRELGEELGIDRAPGSLLGVDYRRAVDGVRGDALRFVFAGGVLRAEDVGRFRIATEEISEWRFVDAGDLDEYVIPAMARRIRACVAGAGAYLEEGYPPPA